MDSKIVALAKQVLDPQQPRIPGPWPVVAEELARAVIDMYETLEACSRVGSLTADECLARLRRSAEGGK